MPKDFPNQVEIIFLIRDFTIEKWFALVKQFCSNFFEFIRFYSPVSRRFF